MKKTLTFALACGTLFILLFAGCKKTTTATTSTGTISGYVTLWDQYGGQVLANINTTSVTLNGSQTATTDATGKYTFTGVAAGIYTLSFNNTNYGSIASNQVQFVGTGNLDHDVKLSAIPNFSDTLLVVTDSSIYVVLNGSFTTTDTRKRTVAVFVGASSSVTSAPATYLRNYSVVANKNLSTFTLLIPVSDLNDLGFTSGSTVYFAAYGAATDYATTSSYEDLANTGRQNYSALSTTYATASTILP